MQPLKNLSALCIAFIFFLPSLAIPGETRVKLEKISESLDFIDLGIIWIPGFTVDRDGNVFILESQSQKIFKLD